MKCLPNSMLKNYSMLVEQKEKPRDNCCQVSTKMMRCCFSSKKPRGSSETAIILFASIEKRERKKSFRSRAEIAKNFRESVRV